MTEDHTQSDIYDLLAEDEPPAPPRSSSALPIGEYLPERLTCSDQHLPSCYNPIDRVTACICGTAWWVGQVGVWQSIPRHAPGPGAPLLGIGIGAPGLREVETEFYGWDTYFLHADDCPHSGSDVTRPCLTPGGTCGDAEPTTCRPATEDARAQAVAPAGVCPRCARRHSMQDARVAGSRFSLGSHPYAFRATYDGAPIRAAREQAIQDMCDHRVLHHTNPKPSVSSSPTPITTPPTTAPITTTKENRA